MNLPNYFLADLPPEAVLSPVMIAEACQTLKRNREQYLAARSTESLVKTLSRVADAWLQVENPFRQLALKLGPGQTGFSRETLARGLDNFFGQLTRDNFHALLVQEFGDTKRLDALTATVVDQRHNRMAIINAPEFQVHIAAGNIPNPTLMSMVFGLLTRSAQFVKCASDSSFLPRIFAHSLYEADPKLGACLEVAEWRGGHAALEGALFAEADCVTATGSDETLAAIRAPLSVRTRFLGYGHRVSFGFVAGEDLFGSSAKKSWRARRMMWWLGTSLAACRRMSFTSNSAVRCCRNNSRSCSLRNWNDANRSNPEANCRRKTRPPLRRGVAFTKCARPMRRERRSIGAARIQPHGRWFTRRMHAFRCPA